MVLLSKWNWDWQEGEEGRGRHTVRLESRSHPVREVSCYRSLKGPAAQSSQIFPRGLGGAHLTGHYLCWDKLTYSPRPPLSISLPVPGAPPSTPGGDRPAGAGGGRLPAPTDTLGARLHSPGAAPGPGSHASCCHRYSSSWGDPTPGSRAEGGPRAQGGHTPGSGAGAVCPRGFGRPDVAPRSSPVGGGAELGAEGRWLRPLAKGPCTTTGYLHPPAPERPPAPPASSSAWSTPSAHPRALAA